MFKKRTDKRWFSKLNYRKLGISSGSFGGGGVIFIWKLLGPGKVFLKAFLNFQLS